MVGRKPWMAAKVFGLAVGIAAVLGTAFASTSFAAALPASISESTTLTAEGGPYTGSSVVVPEGITLKVMPGTVIKLTGVLTVNGRLEIEGTSADPVVLTSPYDDSHGGDTNADGGATVPKPGNWNGLVLSASAGGFIGHARIEYAGSGNAYAIAYSGSSSSPVSIEHSTIEYSKAGAIGLTSASPVIQDNIIANNGGTGINSFTSGAAVIHNNVISKNGWDGISLSAGAEKHISVDIEGNVIEANKEAGIRVVANTASRHIDSAQMGGNEVKNNGGTAIIYEAFSGSGAWAAPIPTDLTTNTLSGNKKNAIWLSGTVLASQTWSSPYVIVIMANGVLVDSSATLTMAPGEVVKGEGGGGGLYIAGALDSNGTAEEPVTFTSVKDDSIAGDTNGDGSTSSPAAGDWRGISFSKTQLSELSFMGFRYAESALSIEFLDGLFITDSDFVHNKAAIKVAHTAELEPALTSLPCVPPYTAFAWAERDWFGPLGLPAPSINLAEYLGAAIPAKYASLFSWASALASEVQPNYGLENTIPFSIYSCPAIGIPPIPMTPVHLVETQAVRHFAGP